MRLGVVPLYNIEELRDMAASGSGVDLSSFNYLKFVERAVRRGFKHIEITGDIHFFIPNAFNENVLESLRNFARDHDLSFSVHLPIWSIELSSPNKVIRNASVEVSVETINFFEEIKPVNYVVHAFGSLASEFSRLNVSEGVKRYILMFFQAFAAESLQALIDETGIDSRRLALEVVEFPWEYTFELVENFNTSICYDTGHLLSGQAGHLDPIDFLKKHYDRIIELHLHDAVPKKDPRDYMYIDHLPLGEGKLPYCELLKILKERNYSGTLVFELGLEGVFISLERISKICGFNLREFGYFGGGNM